MSAEAVRLGNLVVLAGKKGLDVAHNLMGCLYSGDVGCPGWGNLMVLAGRLPEAAPLLGSQRRRLSRALRPRRGAPNWDRAMAEYLSAEAAADIFSNILASIEHLWRPEALCELCAAQFDFGGWQADWDRLAARLPDTARALRRLAAEAQRAEAKLITNRPPDNSGT
ncbi:MAG: hypothetical protein F4Y61_08115 [Rhodothermaceae bacterium]|nr:hypothetical protein [Rhodothermaceae bacterium]